MSADLQESNVLFKGPCSDCGSSDACAVYDDGHTFCFSCDTHAQPQGPEGVPSDGHVPNADAGTASRQGLLPVGEYRALGKRQITEDTCKKFGYSISADKHGKTCQVASFKRDGKIIAQKLRYPDKGFKYLGEKGAGLWGEHLWKDGGRMLVITEGEIDALTVSQLQGNKWPVVSLPNGADRSGKGAARDVAKSIDFVTSFDKVIFMFDMDDPGHASAVACAKLCKPGQAFVASLPSKDPNECLLNGQGREVISAMWDAKPYRPDGIVNAADLWELVRDPLPNSAIDYPWPALNGKTRGNRKGELVVWTSGSGLGKSAVLREVFFDLFKAHDKTVGVIMLEESKRRTAEGMMSLELNHPLHLNRDGLNDTDIRGAFDNTVASRRLWIYDHWGSTEASNLIDRVRYLATACECDYVLLDHISIAVSDAEANQDSNLNERQLIDMLMTKLRCLVEETGVGLHIISHLRRPAGDKGHERGAETSLSQLRGSHAIAQLADMVIGLERDQQDEMAGNEMLMRVLKNRFSGETGPAGSLYYDISTGRLRDVFIPGQDGGNTDY